MRYLIDGNATTEHKDLLLDRLNSRHDYIVLDVETNGFDPYKGDHIIGLALYFPRVDESYYVAVRHPARNVQSDYWLLVLHRLSEHPAVQVGYNYKFDLHFLTVDGMEPPQQVEDVMLLAHLVNENESLSNKSGRSGAYQLKRLAKKYLGRGAVADETALKNYAAQLGIDPKAEMWKLRADEYVADYAMADVELTWKLREFYQKPLRDWQLEELAQRHNEFLLKALFRMERNGMKINVDTIQQHRRELGPKLDALEDEFDAEVRRMGVRLDTQPGSWFNPRSPQQVKRFFQLKGHDLESTDKYTLTAMAQAGNHWAQKILDYRVLQRADRNYYTALLDAADPDWFIHPTLNAIGTVSGRLSCSNPNLQQVPRKSDSYRVKEVFNPRPGYRLYQIDFKQLELRLAVHYADEETMRAMFNNGDDMHAYTGNQLGVPRQTGKTANFSFLYGMGPKTGAIRLGTDEETAAEIIYGWHDLYPAFKQAYKTWEAVARQPRDREGRPGGSFQYIRLPSGRLRRFDTYVKYPQYTADGYKLEPPYYTAWNAYIQGTAAWVTEEAILRVCNRFTDNDIFKPVLTVHDSVLFEIKVGYEDEIIPEIVRLMTDWPQFDPQMAVDVEVTDTTWADLQEYEEFTYYG